MAGIKAWNTLYRRYGALTERVELPEEDVRLLADILRRKPDTNPIERAIIGLLVSHGKEFGGIEGFLVTIDKRGRTVIKNEEEVRKRVEELYGKHQARIPF